MNKPVAFWTYLTFRNMTYVNYNLTHWGRDKMTALFPDDIFKSMFFNEYAWILIKISLKFVPRDLIDNISALVQIMAWRRPGQNQYLNQWWIVDTYMCHYDSMCQCTFARPSNLCKHKQCYQFTSNTYLYDIWLSGSTNSIWKLKCQELIDKYFLDSVSHSTE